MSLLLLDCYVDPAGGSGNFLRWTEGRAVEVLRPAHGAALPLHLGSHAGVLITGSAASWADGVPWGEPLLHLLRTAAEEGVPVLGVCFGHQALGAAFGRGVRKAPVPEVGWKEVRVHDATDPVLGALAPGFCVFLSHEDEVVPDPGPLQVLASTALCPVAAVRLPGAPIWGVQFHAELGLEEAQHLVGYRSRKHPQLALDVEAELERAAHAHEVAPGLFGRFLDVVDARAR